MAGNSRDSLLERMKEGSVTWGWGAISVFNRTRLNRILQQQWIDNYDGSGYLPPFSGRVFLNTDRTEYADLDKIVLGKPLLSFEKKYLSDSKAKLTLSILSGSYTAYQAAGGAIESVLYSYRITEAQGFNLTVDIDLSMVVGEVDHQGRVVLDLSKGSSFDCNLAGPARKDLGIYFEQRFNNLPEHRRVLELGRLDFDGYGPLQPTMFAIRTQSAPEADRHRASNWGDGAVVVFIKLRAQQFGGDFPSWERFPYLIPDDQDAQGKALYSSSLILSKEFIEQSDDDKLALIHSLLFPGEKNVFVEKSRHTPHDLVLFGNIDPSRTTVTIEPLFHSIKAGGQPFQYTALRDGKPLSVSWSVESLNTHGSAGTIGAGNGLYQPVAASQIGQETVRNVVSASYIDPVTQVQHRVSALLLVTAEPMAISPVVAPCLLRGTQQPITFVASAVSGASLTWNTPAHGSLTANGNTAIYIPPSTPLEDDLVVQYIEARDSRTGDTVRASVLLLRYAPDIEVLPRFVRSISPSSTVQLKESEDRPTYKRSWKVFGEGTVKDGLFSAPATISSPVSVVVCDILDKDGEVYKSGYSIIQLSAFVQESTWTDLSRFWVQPERSDKAYRNGLQQIPLRIEIATTDGDGLLREERDSLRLVYAESNAMVPDIQKGQEGIEYESYALWAQTFTPNRFNPFPGTFAAGTVNDSQPRARTTFDYLYLHNRDNAVVSQRFYARFDGPGGVWRSDIDAGANANGIVTLKPMAVPTAAKDHFTFERRRVAGGSGPGGPDTNDDFDYHLRTTDYWTLSYKKNGVDALNFKTLQFLSNESNSTPVSIVQWESTYWNERMFSYTAYAFNDEKVPGSGRKMQYDPFLIARAKVENIALKHELEGGDSVPDGKLVISLFRVDDLIRKDSLLPQLENKTLNIVLIDEEGNRHNVPTRFVLDNRNKLQLVN